VASRAKWIGDLGGRSKDLKEKGLLKCNPRGRVQGRISKLRKRKKKISGNPP